VLAVAAAVGGAFDFIIIHFEGFAEVFTSRSIPSSRLAEKAKLVFRLDVLASILGLGYIIASSTRRSSRRLFPLLVHARPVIGHFGAQLS